MSILYLYTAMDLVQQVSATLEIDSSKAEKGVGAVPRLGRIVLGHLRATIGAEQVEKFLQGAPALR